MWDKSKFAERTCEVLADAIEKKIEKDTTARNRMNAVTRVAVSRMLGDLPVSKMAAEPNRGTQMARRIVNSGLMDPLPSRTGRRPSRI